MIYYINDSEKASTPYTFTCTSSGYSADITITDSAGTTVSIPSITTNGTVDISTLADGDLSVTAIVTDGTDTLGVTTKGTTLDTIADILDWYPRKMTPKFLKVGNGMI